MNQQRTRFFRSGRNTLFGLALLAITSVLLPSAAQAAVSAGATIFNEASVTYDFLAATGINQTSNGTTVTVDTLAAAPTISVTPLTRSTTVGGSVSYVYTITSNSNGPDTYTVTAINSTNSATIATDSVETFTIDNITLWGGIVVACQGVVAGADEVCLPAGAETGLAGTETVILNGNAYTVGTITAGTAQTTGTPEVTTTIQLVDDITAHGVAASTAAAADPIGEYGSLTMDQDTGTLNVGETTGTYTTNVTFTTTGTDSGGATVDYSTSLAVGNQVITTINSLNVSFAKAASTLTAKPGDTITYTLTITNNEATDLSNVVVTDTAPIYTTLTPGTTRLNGALVGDSTGGVNVGTIAAGSFATITFEVTVD